MDELTKEPSVTIFNMRGRRTNAARQRYCAMGSLKLLLKMGAGETESSPDQ
jgi:hypothetical protein